jgi:predicted metalloprotease with PDZ domain
MNTRMSVFAKLIWSTSIVVLTPFLITFAQSARGASGALLTVTAQSESRERVVTRFAATNEETLDQSSAPTSIYHVRIAEDNPLKVFVEAQIPVKDGHLFMAQWGADHLPGGWATFVSKLEITDVNGRPLAFVSNAKGEWTNSDKFAGMVKLSYEIDLSFTKTKWRYGNEQAGIYQDNALFIVTKALFILSDTTAKHSVTFDVPASWKTSTPWEASSAEKRTFLVKNNDDLINNSIVLGKHVEFIFDQGNFTFTLALLGPTEKARDLVALTLKKTLLTYIGIFDKTPRSTYLMTIFYADEADAEAFSKSAAFSEAHPLTKDNLIRWGNTIAHELFHSWNGAAIKGDDYASSRWFAEGFTEYFANLALIRQGLISDDLYIKKMEKMLGLYFYFNQSPAFDGASLKAAGSKQGRYRLGIYDGGWAAAFCLDVMIRDETNGRRSLEDFMRLMYERYGLTAKKYSYQDLVATASEVIGRDISEFFKKHVEGTETLPVLEYLKRSGFEGYTQFYDGEIYISKSASASEKAKMIQRRIMKAR